jgi:hypothetical protein
MVFVISLATKVKKSRLSESLNGLFATIVIKLAISLTELFFLRSELHAKGLFWFMEINC